ncbi:MAG: TIGR02300 family protein [Alphaproteobacteria bacterium]|nr:TIGR02300 family protein [Alphaproteobacteria bacterium]
MSNDKWGTKRICASCGAKFYDLNREPIKCPKCGKEFDAEELLKHSFSAKAKKARKNVQQLDDDDEINLSEEELMSDDLNDDEDELNIIEDASDIGDDSHDMAEVINNIEKGDLHE